MSDDKDDSFNASKAEIFEALGHPTRIRILQELIEKPLSFSDLKRATGLESNGLLTFHLGKLHGLVRSNPEGAYVLTDEGREALRIVDASEDQTRGRTLRGSPVHVPHLNTVLAGLVVVLIVLASASALEYNQIQGLDSKVQTTQATVTDTSLSIIAATITDTATTISTSTVYPSVIVPIVTGGALLAIGAGNYSYYTFTLNQVPLNESIIYTLTGSLTATNPITVYMINPLGGFPPLSNGSAISVWDYNSGRVTSYSMDLKIGPGTYSLIFSNYDSTSGTSVRITHPFDASGMVQPQS